MSAIRAQGPSDDELVIHLALDPRFSSDDLASGAIGGVGMNHNGTMTNGVRAFSGAKSIQTFSDVVEEGQ